MFLYILNLLVSARMGPIPIELLNNALNVIVVVNNVLDQATNNVVDVQMDF